MTSILIASSSICSVGGVQKTILEISKRLRNKGFEIIFVSAEGMGKREEGKFEGFNIIKLNRVVNIKSIPMNISWYKDLQNIIERFKPDLINGHLQAPGLCDILCNIAKKRKIPFILTYHNDFVDSRFLWNAVKTSYYYHFGLFTLRNSSRIIVLSNYYAERSKFLSSYKNKLDIITGGVDQDIMKPTFNINELEKNNLLKYKYVLYVGRMSKESRHKGLDYLIRSMRYISEELKLVVIGQGNDIEWYRKLCNNERLTHRVLFLDNVSDDLLPVYYSNCFTTVLPSYNMAEGLGLVLLEAQSCGSPVIGSDIGGIPYAIEEGKTGYLVKPKDPFDISEKINFMLDHPGMVEAMRRNARDRILNKFTWDHAANQYDELMNRSLTK